MRMLLPCVTGAALLMVAPAARARAGDVDPWNVGRGAAPAALVATGGTHGHAGPAGDPDSGAELLDTPAPAWTFTRWIGPPLTLASLRGKVVLLRWWTEDCR